MGDLAELPRARPRWATKRTPSRDTLGPRVCAVMERLGQPPMPWQRDLLDVALEVIPGEGLAYDEVILTVPRQSGKTSLELGVITQRGVGWDGPQLTSYTEINRTRAIEKFVDDQKPVLEKSPFKRLYKYSAKNGAEHLRWANGSKHEFLKPTKDAGHGRARHLCWVDEAFELDPHVEDGLVPAMITTHPWSQFWISSTVGDFACTYLNGKMELGRRAAEAGVDRGICYLEYSAEPDDDPEDEATWWRCMPALGHTQTVAGIRTMKAKQEPGEFARAFLNIPKPREQKLAIDPAVWSASRGAAQITGRAWWAVSTGPERSSAAIARAGYRDDGVVQLVVMEHGPGVGWVAPKLAEILPGGTIAVDKFLDGSLIPDLEKAKLAVKELGTADVINAYAKTLEYLTERKAVHAKQAVLDDAAGSAVTRPVRGGDGALFRRGGGIDVSPLVACSLALWALISEPEAKPRLKAIN